MIARERQAKSDWLKVKRAVPLSQKVTLDQIWQYLNVEITIYVNVEICIKSNKINVLANILYKLFHFSIISSFAKSIHIITYTQFIHIHLS